MEMLTTRRLKRSLTAVSMIANCRPLLEFSELSPVSASLSGGYSANREESRDDKSPKSVLFSAGSIDAVGLTSSARARSVESRAEKAATPGTAWSCASRDGISIACVVA